MIRSSPTQRGQTDTAGTDRHSKQTDTAGRFEATDDWGHNMTVRRKQSLTILLALLAALVALTLAGCGDSSGDEPTTSAPQSSEPASTDTVATETSNSGTQATTETSAQDTSGADSVSGLTSEEQDDALDIAKAYLVGLTDFTSDQFDWNLEAAAQDSEGGWWVRVSAVPKNDTSLDPVQIFVKRPAGNELWVGHDLGTGIDPATDESFPEEVRDRL